MQPWFCVQHVIWGVQSNHCYFLFKSSSKTLLSERAHANLRKWLTCLFASLAKEQFSLQAISPYICVLPKIPSLSDGIYDQHGWRCPWLSEQGGLAPLMSLWGRKEIHAEIKGTMEISRGKDLWCSLCFVSSPSFCTSSDQWTHCLL